MRRRTEGGTAFKKYKAVFGIRMEDWDNYKTIRFPKKPRNQSLQSGKRVPLEERRELVRQMMSGSKTAKEKLFESMLWMPIWMTRKIARGFRMEHWYEDLEQVGALALWDALDKIDDRVGFVNYLKLAVQTKIGLEIRKMKSKGLNPYSANDVPEIITAPEICLDESHKFADMLHSAEFKTDLEGELEKTCTSKIITILRLRYGSANGNPYTLGEIGRFFGVSRENIRQIINRTLTKLKKSQKLRSWAE